MLPRRRWFRVSLRGLMVLVLVVGGGLGWKLHRVRTERAAVAVIRAAGGSILYDYEFPLDPEIMTRVQTVREPAAPRWLRRWLGDDCFRSVAFVRMNQPTDATLAAVGELDGLIDLNLFNVQEGVRDWSVLGRARHVKAIKLQGWGVDAAAIRGLGTLPNLRSLTLDAQLVKDEDVRPIAGFRALRKLAFCDNPRLSDAGVARLLEVGLTNLESFEWTDARVMLPQTVHALTQYHLNLRALSLQASPVRDDDLPAIGTLTRLRTLNLNKTWVTDTGLVHLAPLSHLESLQIHLPEVTDAGMRSVGKLVQLRELNLTGSAVDDAGLAELAHLRHLDRLELVATRLTDAGITTLSRFPALKSLDLSHLPLTDAGLTPLARVQTLKWLNLGGTEVTRAGMAGLRAALPGCKVRALVLISAQALRSVPRPSTPQLLSPVQP